MNHAVLSRTSRSILDDAAIRHQRGPFEAVLFGKPFNHSFAGLRDRPELRTRIAYVAEALGVKTILAPSPIAFNATRIKHTDLTDYIRLEELITMWRNANAPADVVNVPRGLAMAMSVGGCAALVAHAKGHLFAAHAGRDSVINRARIKHKAGIALDMRDRPRDHEGVVETIMHAFAAYGIDACDVHMHIIGAVPGFYFPHRFDDPGYGAFNAALRDDIVECHPRFGEDEVVQFDSNVMCLDIPKLVAAQCVALGFDPSKIDLENAYAGPESTWLDGTPGKERNLFMVVHR